MANFAAVRTRYYKHKAAIAILDHAHSKRNGFTKSSNVYKDFSGDNQGRYLSSESSCLDGYESMRTKHTKLKNKSPRSDMNTLFEHVVILSVEHYENLEAKHGKDQAIKETLQALRDYAKKIEEEFGFKPLGFDLHLDEGYEDDNGNFKRNIHAHVMFYNYDFKAEIAPLRGLMKKGINKDTGKSFDLNPNFERMQDFVAGSFSKLGFVRGQSHGLDNVEHKSKTKHARAALGELEQQIKLKNEIIKDLNQEIASLKLSERREREKNDLVMSFSAEKIKEAEIATEGVSKLFDGLQNYDGRNVRSFLELREGVEHYEQNRDQVAEVKPELADLADRVVKNVKSKGFRP